MATVAFFESDSTSPVGPLRLDHLPYEILLSILAYVPFNRRTLCDICLVCRHFRAIVSYHGRPSYLKRVAEQQFPIFVHALGALGDSKYDVEILDMLVDVYDAAVFILNEVKKNMTAEDHAFEHASWEEDFFNCLMLWERVGRFSACISTVYGRQYTKSYNLLPLDTNFMIRYMCAKLAKCMCQISWRYLDAAQTGHWGFRLQHLCNDWDVSRLATALDKQLFIKPGRGLHTVCEILMAFSKTPDQLRECKQQETSYSTLCISAEIFTSTYTQCLSPDKLFQSDISPATWLCHSTGDLDNEPEDWLCVVQMQSYVARMIRETTEKVELDLEEFICNHENLKMTATEDHRLIASGQLRIPVANTINRWYENNESLRNDLRRHREETAPTPVSSNYLKHCTTSYDWEYAVDRDLLRGESKLRSSLPPAARVLRETLMAIERIETNHRYRFGRSTYTNIA